MSNCEKYEELCSAALDHALTSEEKQELDAHLAVCPSCRAYLEDLREMRSLWKELEVPVPTELHEKMMGAIEAEVQKTIVQTPQKQRRRPPVFTMLAAAAACVMLAVSGDLTGLFGQVSTMPIQPVAKEPLPSTAEVQKPEKPAAESFQQQPIEEKEKPEQQIVSSRMSEEPKLDRAAPPKAERSDAPKPKPEQPEQSGDERQVLEPIQEPPMGAAQMPMSISEEEPPQMPGDMGRTAPPPEETATPAALSVPAELSQMQFARCYDVAGGTELPILDDMTLLVTQEGVSYYSVENNESKIVLVQQELMKHGFQMTLNESSGISIQRSAKAVLLIVHIG